jgi:hypothetical protein
MDGPLSLTLSPSKGERGRLRGSKRESVAGILSPRERARVRGNQTSKCIETA